MDLPLRSSSGPGWGGPGSGANGSSSTTEWQVTTPHDRPVTDKSLQPYSPDGADLIKIVLLGAPGSGKTAIAQQFVWGTFESAYYPTAKKETYYPSVILHDRKYELKIVDIPDIPFFPVNSFYNISDLQAYGLRDANAYILVFDLLCPDSFDYVAGMFSQISESRDLGSVPVVVVGNKTDKVNSNISKSRMKHRDRDEHRDLWERDPGGHNGHEFNSFEHDDAFGHGGGHEGGGFGHFGGGHHYGHHGYGGSRDKHGRHGKNKRDKYGSSSRHGHNSTSSSWSSSRKDKYSRQHMEINWSLGAGPDEHLDKDIADKVTGEWKVMYRECSARNPDSVTDIFKAVMGVFEQVGVVGRRGDSSDDDHGMSRRCVIL